MEFASSVEMHLGNVPDLQWFRPLAAQAAFRGCKIDGAVTGP
jgi:hypothetical protein